MTVAAAEPDLPLRACGSPRLRLGYVYPRTSLRIPMYEVKT